MRRQSLPCWRVSPYRERTESLDRCNLAASLERCPSLRLRLPCQESRRPQWPHRPVRARGHRPPRPPLPRHQVRPRQSRRISPTYPNLASRTPSSWLLICWPSISPLKAARNANRASTTDRSIVRPRSRRVLSRSRSGPAVALCITEA